MGRLKPGQMEPSDELRPPNAGTCHPPGRARQEPGHHRGPNRLAVHSSKLFSTELH